MTPPQDPTLRAHKFTRSLLSGCALFLLASLFVLPSTPAHAERDDVETAALAPGGLRPTDEAQLPHPIKDEDAARYRRIFALQDAERWAAADKEIAKLSNKLLLGHVLAQRYLSPTGYKAKYAELSAWLEHYADHPDAPQIYRLAVSRAPRGAHLRRPEGQVYNPAIAGSDAAAGDAVENRRPLGALEQRRASELRRAIRHEIDENAFSQASHLLTGSEAQRLFSASEYDQLRAEIVDGFYFLNQDREALAMADATPSRAKHVNAAVEWAGGLAAWRLRHYGEAAHHFERLATGDSADSWTRSAGAYWASRAYLRDRAPEKVTRWLEVAGNYPYTFYGILARRLAGKPFDYNWELPSLTRADVAQITALPAGLRAVALVEVGEDARAEQELRRINPAQPEIAHAVLAVSQRADMPSLGMQLAQQVVNSAGRPYDAALYPVPSWEPQGGFSVDRALVLALIRQESKFLPHATSRAGAAGLMQLMPGTARFVSDGTSYGGRRHQLFDPATNITLGQNYIAHLMSIDNVGDNLFLITAAYNGGPGNLMRWQRQIKHDNDPLLFLESIPNRETRQFVEHVLANYWIYRDQLDEPTLALDAIAAGKWPTYNSPVSDFVPVMGQHGGH